MTISQWVYWEIRRYLADHDPDFLQEMDAAE